MLRSFSSFSVRRVARQLTPFAVPATRSMTFSTRHPLNSSSLIYTGAFRSLHHLPSRQFASGTPPQSTSYVDPKAAPVGDALEKYTIDMTALAREGKLDPVIGRTEEIRRLIQVLSRRRKNNPVVIGEAGVGKTAVVEGLAQRIVAGDVPESIAHVRVLSLDLAALVAGAKYRGEFEERFKALLRDCAAKQNEIFLFIDEIHLLMGAGGTGGGDGQMDAANLLKPMLARGELHCIGATTLKEFRLIEKDAALARRFQPIYLGEPSIEDSISVLRGVAERYELHHGVRIRDDALIAAATLAARYLTERRLPDAALDLVDEAASRLRLQQESKPERLENLDRKILQLRIERVSLQKERDTMSRDRLSALERELATAVAESDELTRRWAAERERVAAMKRASQRLEEARRQFALAESAGNYAKASELKYGTIPTLEQQTTEATATASDDDGGELVRDAVTADDIAAVVSRATGVPLRSLLAGERTRLLDLEQLLAARVIGQREAVLAVADAVRVSRSGLSAANRPTATFLFIGPTGCGKTELAKAISDELFHGQMLRFDMSEYMERHSVARLIGAPPGYVGYDEGGALTEAVRRRPHALLLFDEIEKAHRDVHNLLLQLMDDGRLTDSQGRTVDFTNTLLVMTSNIGAELLSPDAADAAAQRDLIDAALRRSMRPEFLNRIDAVCHFNYLTRDDMQAIVRLELEKVEARVAAARPGAALVVSGAARAQLAEQGYVPAMGARPLRRVIQSRILSELSKLLIDTDIGVGDAIHADARDGAFTFSVDKKQKKED